MEVFFPFALVSIPRSVYTPKKWLSIFTFIDGFPPTNLIVFCRSPPGICAVSTKKTRWLVSLWGTGFPCSRDEFPSWPRWSFIPPPQWNGTFFSNHSVSNKALRFHFGPTPMWESDTHTSTVYRQNKSQMLQGKHKGIELSLEIFYVSFPPFWCLFFQKFICQAV